MRPLIFFAITGLLLITACQTNDDNFTTIQGRVLEQGSGTPLPGAAVVITQPMEFANNFTSTDSAGQFLFGELDIEDATDLTLRATLAGYNPQVRNVTALPEQLISLNFDLTEENDGSTDNGGNTDEEVAGEPGRPAAIVLNSVSREFINIRQTGGEVSTTFRFTVQDSAGRSMDASTPADVNFQILNGPGGGESVVPDQVTTNDDGLVVTSLFSGDSAGVVRVEAFVVRDDGVRISSSPILVAIHGGFPSPNNFFVAPANRNLEGYGLIYRDAPAEIYNVTASVGDRFGNPVKIGTSVDFRSPNSGIVQGSATTNENGFASVNFFPNGASPTGHPNGTGFFDVRAHTFDENNNDIIRNVTLLFTTRDAVITFTESSFDVPSNGSTNVNFTVTDLNGYPMAAGTKINVTSVAGIEVTGDFDITLGDHFTGGPGRTDFTVSLADLDDENSNQVSASMTVTVTTPSGYETTRTLQGQRAKFR